ncbi:MAG: hypothetical protein ACKO2S_04990, partial [Burkholderiaceae bacterium]
GNSVQGALDAGAVVAGELTDQGYGRLQVLSSDGLVGEIDCVPVEITRFRQATEVKMGAW